MSRDRDPHAAQFKRWVDWIEEQYFPVFVPASNHTPVQLVLNAYGNEGETMTTASDVALLAYTEALEEELRKKSGRDKFAQAETRKRIADLRHEHGVKSAPHAAPQTILEALQHLKDCVGWALEQTAQRDGSIVRPEVVLDEQWAK